jgi:hypothetical protein
LGGLYARKGEKDKALDVYNKGLFYCKAAGENRAFNELQSAIEDLSDEE